MILNYFKPNIKHNLDFEDFIKIVIIPFNHKIKKYKFILTVEDLSSIYYINIYIFYIIMLKQFFFLFEVILNVKKFQIL